MAVTSITPPKTCQPACQNVPKRAAGFCPSLALQRHSTHRQFSEQRLHQGAVRGPTAWIIGIMVCRQSPKRYAVKHDENDGIFAEV